MEENKMGWKDKKPNNMYTIPTSLENDFFKWWCIFLRPFVSLTDRETDVIACFLKYRWKLSRSISDPAILDSMLMSDDIRSKVIEECHITLPHFYVVMSTLRKKKVIEDNRIVSKLIPNIRMDDNGVFKMLILFADKSVLETATES